MLTLHGCIYQALDLRCNFHISPLLHMIMLSCNFPQISRLRFHRIQFLSGIYMWSYMVLMDPWYHIPCSWERKCFECTRLRVIWWKLSLLQIINYFLVQLQGLKANCRLNMNLLLVHHELTSLKWIWRNAHDFHEISHIKKNLSLNCKKFYFILRTECKVLLLQ